VCIAIGGACKSGQTCKADPTERSGGICVGAARQAAAPGVQPHSLPYGAKCSSDDDCAAGPSPGCYGGICSKFCGSDTECGAGFHCQQATNGSGAACAPGAAGDDQAPTSTANSGPPDVTCKPDEEKMVCFGLTSMLCCYKHCTSDSDCSNGYTCGGGPQKICADWGR
jgi:hypothetical protein